MPWREIAQMCREQNWRLAVWDIEQGLQIPGQGNGQSADAGGSDPLAAIRSINALAIAGQFGHSRSRPTSTASCQSAEIVQALAQQISAGKAATAPSSSILSPVVQVPVELEKLFVVVEHDLPGREQLEADRPWHRHRRRRIARRRQAGHGARRGLRLDPVRGRGRVSASASCGTATWPPIPSGN